MHMPTYSVISSGPALFVNDKNNLQEQNKYEISTCDPFEFKMDNFILNKLLYRYVKEKPLDLKWIKLSKFLS